MHNKFKVGIASRKILMLVSDNLELLTKKENLPALAYILWKWDRLAHSGRTYGHIEMDDASGEHIDGMHSCDENPKYEIENIDCPDEATVDLVYDAWAVSVSNEGYGYLQYMDFYLDEVKLLPPTKTNMTLEDWGDRLRMSDFGIRDYLFCVIGTGIALNADGYPCASGPANSDLSIFGEWDSMKDKLPEEVSSKFFELINLPECQDSINTAIISSKSHYEIELAERCKRRRDKLSNIISLLSGEPITTVRHDPMLLPTFLEKIEDLVGVIDLTLPDEELIKIDTSRLENAYMEYVLASVSGEGGYNGIPYGNNDTPTHYPFSKDSGLICKYEKFHPSFGPALVKTAKEVLDSDVLDTSNCTNDEQIKYATRTFNERKRIAKRVIKYFK
jgi:hypothetical protein